MFIKIFRKYTNYISQRIFLNIHKHIKNDREM